MNKIKDSSSIEKYKFYSGKIEIEISIKKIDGDYVPSYITSVATISPGTEILLEKIRNELVKTLSFSAFDLSNNKEYNQIEQRFHEAGLALILKYFPDTSTQEQDFLAEYLVQKSLGFGNIKILLDDPYTEEIVVNGANEPIWTYHKKHGWLKTDIILKNEQEIKRYAATIGRKVGRQISMLKPLLDATLNDGSRVNATLTPISVHGNTITFRKFSSQPMTITHFLKSKTLSFELAAMVWHAIENEMSLIISGGTASGKTSMLNIISNFFPPNQRILSIEDTREIKLPKYLHWVPMLTRMPNAEGKGTVTMSDLLVNSLRMRPDRIVVGEVRRKEEIETLFEAIHTGHSCYATIHANDCEETVNRLLNPPFNVPKTMLPAVSLIINQYRNRRTGQRRTFQLAEINKDSTINLLYQYNPKNDNFSAPNKSKTLMNNFKLFSGMSETEVNKELKDKILVLKYLVKQRIETVDDVGKVIADYYLEKAKMMKVINKKIRKISKK